MSIFRETFPDFVTDELNRRQEGMSARTPSFVHQLNSRSSWVRMTSGVDYNGNNKLASQYVLQGGTLLNDNLRKGLSGDGTGAYDRLSPGGNPQRLGIRPMPGITNVEIQSKGAYGSLQEATVSFNCWDIRQLEELELLYMRPGYTVLLEFGWDYCKDKDHFGSFPKYPILEKSEIALNDAFREIYSLIIRSKGTYDALLGYVKNYNWSARDDGGYDCTTTIISLGEVLESLKCNWVPIATTAFNIDGSGLLGKDLVKGNASILDSYQQGIIPGLLHEIWDYSNLNLTAANQALKLVDAKKGNSYNLYISKDMKNQSKNNRGGFPKPLGKDNDNTEVWITLGSFCELLNNYVFLKDIKDNPLVQVITYQTEYTGSTIYEGKDPKSLECIASPLAISTNLGVCLVRNDNWASLSIKQSQSGDKVVSIVPELPNFTIQKAIEKKDLSIIGKDMLNGRFQLNTSYNPYLYTYMGNIEEDLKDIAASIIKGITKIELINEGGKLISKFTFFNGTTFKSLNEDSTQFINFFNYFVGGKKEDNTLSATSVYNSLFFQTYKDQQDHYIKENPFEQSIVKDSSLTKWTPEVLIKKIEDIFSKYSLNAKLAAQTNAQVGTITNAIIEDASNSPGLTSDTLSFLLPNSTAVSKTLGKISNIYVNVNFLYSQAVSRNSASNDHQNTNNISVREYIQGILREIQNSLGNINNFDLQVDIKNAVGRIIDINFTGETSIKPFEIQIHNTKSIVRKYSFQSKIFPEMGSIIAISAQDASGVGRLGYDNATLVAWNEGIKDRLVPKKDFALSERLSQEEDPTSFILPFLTKLHKYFISIQGSDSNNVNFAYGGLNFAYRDFLSNLTRFDPRNRFKTIIPTELSLTLDGLGGLVIGNLFKINQDIVPKGYRNIPGRDIAYIVTKLGHDISENDWTTHIHAYPIIFENGLGKDITKDWDDNQYPGNIIIKPKPKEINLNSALQQAYDKAENFEPGFKNKVKTVAFNIGVAEYDLVKVMYKESGGTLSPSTTNPIGCAGLIQFCPDSARGNIKTIKGKKYLLSNLKLMTRMQQLDVVEEYFKSFGFNSLSPRSLADLYLSTFYPVAVGKPGHYVIGSEASDPEYKFKVANQNPAIAKDSTAFINGRKVIDVNAVVKFINS